MKLLLFYLLSMVVSITTFAQNERFYLFNDVWKNVTKQTDATYFLVINSPADTVHVCKYYHINGSMIRTETFRNAECTQPAGFFVWYNNDGYADSAGFVNGKLRVGTWQYFNKGKLANKVEYINFKPWRTTNFTKDSVYYADSTAEKYIPPSNFIEAQYTGGYEKYRADLQRFLVLPERGKSLGVKGAVLVQFTVEPSGKTNDFFLLKSVEWSIDESAVFAMSKTNKWLPATLNGLPVASSQQQNLSFVFSN